MQTITLDGKEYVLVPKEQLQPVEEAPAPTPPANNARETHPSAFHGGGSILSDFTDVETVDDGLATNAEKRELIKVHVPMEDQTVITPQPVVAPKAQGRKYEYRERFVNRDLMPSDVMTFPRISRQMLENNPEDPMIKADSKLRKEDQLFYGPGTQVEGVGY